MPFMLRRPSEGLLLIGCMKMQYIECKLVARKRSSLMNHTLYEYFDCGLNKIPRAIYNGSHIK